MAHASPSGPGAARVLIADDEPLVRSTLRMLLKAHGYGVQEVASGEEAVQTYLAAPQDFDVLILDINIGALTGDEAFRQLIKKHPGTKAILLSGGINPPPNCPGARYLQKPFENAELLRMIGELVDNSSTGP